VSGDEEDNDFCKEFGQELDTSLMVMPLMMFFMRMMVSLLRTMQLMSVILTANV